MNNPLINNSPFSQFTDRMNKDLHAWTLRKQKINQLLHDYKSTLYYVDTQFQYKKIMVNLGQGVMSEAKRSTNTIVIRMKQDLYIEFSQKQAIKTLKELIKLYEDKLISANKQINKIHASMRQVQELIRQYQCLV